jgi:hypothetical protein
VINQAGTVFELSGPNHQAFTSLEDFISASGGLTPYGGLTLDSSGDIFGTTSSGGAHCFRNLHVGPRTGLPISAGVGSNGALAPETKRFDRKIICICVTLISPLFISPRPSDSRFAGIQPRVQRGLMGG